LSEDYVIETSILTTSCPVFTSSPSETSMAETSRTTD
jgi:hypothetical protein